MGVSKRFGRQVAARRRELGWSARQLAEVCTQQQQVPLTRSTVAKIESGHRSYVTLEEFLALSAALDIERTEYLGRTPNRVTVAVRRPWFAAFAAKDAVGASQLEAVVGRIAAVYGLSPRERDVLGLLLAGRSDRDIADALGVQGQTAYKYTRALLDKLAISNTYELLWVALREVHFGDGSD